MHKPNYYFLFRSIQTLLFLLLIPNAYAANDQATDTKAQSCVKATAMTEEEKKLLGPYMAEAASDREYLTQLTELINDDAEKMRTAALKAFVILLQEQPELAENSVASELKRFLRKARMIEGHTADQAILALYILLQTDSKVASKVLSVAIGILKGKLGKVGKEGSTLAALFEKLINICPGNALYILDGANTAMHRSHTDSSQLQLLELLNRMASIDKVIANKKWFGYMFEMAEHYATYSLLKTDSSTRSEEGINIITTYYTYNYIFPGIKEVQEASQFREPKQKAVIRLYRKLIAADRGRVDMLLKKDLKSTNNILKADKKDAIQSWGCFWRLCRLRCYAEMDARYVEPVLKVVRRAAKDSSWVVRSAAMDVMLSIALNDFPKYGQEAITMAEKGFSTGKKILKRLGAYALRVLKSLNPDKAENAEKKVGKSE